MKRDLKLLTGLSKKFKNILFPLRKLKSRLRLAFGVNPLSEKYGSDRGQTIHRYYLKNFLKKYADDIQGHCLEFADDLYTSQYGKERVKKLDILHKEEGNPKASIIADLTKPNQIPSNQFDCIICTFTLHVVFEFNKFVSELYRILKPGGVLLINVPHVAISPPSYHEFWRFTPEGLQTVLSKIFRAENVTVEAYGNSLSTIADFRGLVVHELSQAELEYRDERFALEVCARAIKPL